MKKILICLLVLCLAISCIACSNEPDVEPEETETKAPISEDDPYAEYLTNLPQRNYGGEEFKILVTTAFDRYFDADEETTDVVEKETIERNMLVEDEYNVELVYTAMDGNLSGQVAFATAIRTSVDGGTPYDLVVAQSYYTMPLATEGYMQDMYGSEYLHLDQEWYHKGINGSATINNHMYGASGDFVISQIATALGLLYNKDMFVDLQYDFDPYQLVRDYQWTYAKLDETVTNVYQDLDNNWYVSDGDRFGITGPPQMANALLAGMGNRLITFDEEGIPTLENYYGDRLITSFEKLLTFFKKDSVTWYDANATSLNMLVSNQTLFCCLGMGEMTSEPVRESTYKIGILPLPLYDETQTEYLSAMQRWEMFFIPQRADFERSCIITEYLNFVTYTEVIPLYWDHALLLRGAEAADDAEMMKLIRSTMYFDTVHIFMTYFGNMSDLAGNLIKLNNNILGSEWSKNKPTYQDGLDLLLEAYGLGE